MVKVDPIPSRVRPAVSLPALVGVFLAALVCLWFHGFSALGWVPILDSANLALHEAGHPLVGWFSERLGVYGGTLFQLLFPALAMAHFWRTGHPVGLALTTVWLGENLLQIARYMADARAQLLPLVGGGEHDWAEILSRWGLLHRDTLLAGLVRLAGCALMLVACLGLWRRYRAATRTAR